MTDAPGRDCTACGRPYRQHYWRALSAADLARYKAFTEAVMALAAFVSHDGEPAEWVTVQAIRDAAERAGVSRG